MLRKKREKKKEKKTCIVYDIKLIKHT
jgi:hypothetical protein